MRIFNCIHEKALSLLQKMDHKLDTLLAYIPTCVNQINSYSSFPVSNIKSLQRHNRKWLKIRDALGQELVVLPPVDDPFTPLIVVSA
jgi:hypothetical protein